MRKTRLLKAALAGLLSVAAISCQEKATPLPSPEQTPKPTPEPTPEEEVERPDVPGAIATLRIDTENRRQISSKTEYINATFTLEDPQGKYWDTPTLTVSGEIRGRGNTTWDFPKKPYRIKFTEKSKVFGMKSNRDWVLVANYSDKTLLRNTMAMEISRICGMEWTPQNRLVEVYLNGAYQGVYDLFQKVEVAKEKVDLNIEGGDLFFEIDTSQDEPVSFTTPVYALPLMFKEPEYPDPATEKMAKDYFTNIDRLLQKQDYGENGVRKYLDIDSFINFFIIQELTKNVDGALRKSSFMSLRSGGKASLCCVWDFDLSLGNANYFTDKSFGSNGPEGWWVKLYCRTGKSDSWFTMLFKDPQFVSDLKSRWNELKPELEQVPEKIRIKAVNNRPAINNNFNQWRILGTYVWPNVKTLGSYDAELDYMLGFYEDRLEWMDKEINKL